MKIDATITKVFEAKTFTNERGTFKFVPIEVEILEDCRRYDGTTFVRENNILVDITGKLAESFRLPVGTSVTLDLQFLIHEKDGRKYQNIRSSYVALR